MNTYVLFSCNIWKNSDSMRLMGVFSNLNTLKKNIKQLIKEGSFECSESFNINGLSTKSITMLIISLLRHVHLTK